MARKRRWGRLPAELVCDVRLSHAAVRMFAALAFHANDAGICWPAITRLAPSISVSRTYAQALLTELERAGWLTRTGRIDTSTGRRVSNAYRLHFDNVPPALSAGSEPDGDDDQSSTSNDLDGNRG